MTPSRAPGWRVAGSYLEACNCLPVCPCRRIGGVPGGRSTHGVCMGVLSWHVDRGHADGVALAELDVVLALHYSDDEPGSPWDFVLYVDQRCDRRQRAALEAIFTGRWGGSALAHFPWAWKPSRELAVRSAAISLGHRSRRGWIRVVDYVDVRIAGPIPEQPSVTCVIPGHDRSGEEVATERLVVTGDLEFEFTGVCGYRADFDYSADEAAGS